MIKAFKFNFEEGWLIFFFITNLRDLYAFVVFFVESLVVLDYVFAKFSQMQYMLKRKNIWL